MPGPRVVVRSVAIDSTAPLAPRKPTREEPWRDRLDKLRAIWSLREGEPFRQPDWNSAKNAALGALRGDGYPRAEWQSTKASIDAVEQAAALSRHRRAGAAVPHRPDPDRRNASLRRGRDSPRRAAFRPAPSTARSCCSTSRSGS